MKKLYRKGTVHPSPLISDHLAFLPAAILTLAAALSPEDKEVLAYLISCSSSNFSGNRKNTHKTAAEAATSSSGDHPPSFTCDCFRCYTSFWVRWDLSPNRQLIHEIIDAFEDGLARGKREKNRRERRKKGAKGSGELTRSELGMSQGKFDESDSVEEIRGGSGGDGNGNGGGGEDCCDGGGGSGGEVEEGIEKGSVRKLVSFIGERLWGVWN
ncbi:hypothetical protein CEY00_Acc09710 [Actinidia chinensis var. chinensis]|uniref:Uncharacterized protein n=1 Tax=Actinidia chinensis var. chinensis TaxID=1590841 RepID=A0A2R6RB67_ACTCC|nr:hypothetical protein CEY00_Acc09710 [Actinidia chinensis var. chinensis]